MYVAHQACVRCFNLIDDRACVQPGIPKDLLLHLPFDTMPPSATASEFADAALLLAPHARHVLASINIGDLSPMGPAWGIADGTLRHMSRELGGREFARLHAAPVLIAVGAHAGQVCINSRALCAVVSCVQSPRGCLILIERATSFLSLMCTARLS